MTQQLLDGPTLIRVLENAFLDKVSKVLRKLLDRQGWCIIPYYEVQRLLIAFARVWRLAHCKLKSKATKRPYVYLLRVKLPLHYFWCNIARCTLL